MNKKIKEIINAFGFKTELQKIVDRLTSQYNLSGLTVVGCRFINPDSVASYDMYSKKVYVNVDADYEDMVLGAYHEFRHHWQACHPEHYKVLLWWMVHPAQYKKYYYTQFCATEEDAKWFALTKGQHGREDLLITYNADKLGKALIRGYLDKLAAREKVSLSELIYRLRQF